MTPACGHYIRIPRPIPCLRTNQVLLRVFETWVQNLAHETDKAFPAKIHDAALTCQAWDGTKGGVVLGFKNCGQCETISDAFPFCLLDHLGGGVFE